MALARAWWMKEIPQASTLPVDSSSPHLTWPWNQSQVGLSFHTLENYIRNSRHKTTFCVHQFRYTKSQWAYETEFTDVGKLIHELTEGLQDDGNILVITEACPELLQALGYYLGITPRFFNFPYVPLSTGNQVAEYAFIHLQFMDMYPPGSSPYESTRSHNSPSIQFDLGQGITRYTWHVTAVDLIYWTEKRRSLSSLRALGVIRIDPCDEIVFQGLRKLMTRNETIPPGRWEEKFGLGQVLSELFHIISHNWSVFLDEAEQHLQYISYTVAMTQTTHEQQKSLSLALHQLSPLWAEVRRRIVCARDATQQMIAHPFFTASGGTESISSYLKKVGATLDDYEKRTYELDTNTNVLINLIFNLATFTDTAIAIQETKAANSLAASIRRVAMLTFFYLPLQVAASIYGMNVREITGDNNDPRVWQYAILSLSLMALTFGIWFGWSKMPRAVISRRFWTSRLLTSAASPRTIQP